MTSLIACVTSDLGTWEHVKRVIAGQDWERIYVICDAQAKTQFSSPKDIEFLQVDTTKLLPELASEMHQKMSGIKDFEVAVNFVSGSGKEHMAFMSAVLKLGVGVRMVVLTKDGVREL